MGPIVSELWPHYKTVSCTAYVCKMLNFSVAVTVRLVSKQYSAIVWNLPLPACIHCSGNILTAKYKETEHTDPEMPHFLCILFVMHM